MRYNLAIGIGSEYLRSAIEPPIQDKELISELGKVTGFTPAPSEVDGATVFYTALPEGLEYGRILREAISVLQANEHQVYVFDRLGRIASSNNPFENERQAGVDVEALLVEAPNLKK